MEISAGSYLENLWSFSGIAFLCLAEILHNCLSFRVELPQSRVKELSSAKLFPHVQFLSIHLRLAILWVTVASSERQNLLT